LPEQPERNRFGTDKLPQVEMIQGALELVVRDRPQAL
jgi:hypothetical protein